MNAAIPTIVKPAAPADNAPHLLVVDDDTRIRSLLSRFLQGEGYRVTTAESAKDARGKLVGLDFDLLILDVMMPGENGFELVKSVREKSHLPILMLTARDETENRINGLELGADDYMAKPFEPRELSRRSSITSRGVNCGAAMRSFISPTANATCCGCSRSRRAKPCRASRSQAMRLRPVNALSMFRSTACAERLKMTPPIR